MFSILTVTTAATVSEQQTYTTDAKDNSIQIEAKYKKASTNKITFNGNGGKINSKNIVSINVNKGSKIKKFPATPKRTGYTFKGWYSKKSGGTKISVNTKPTKSVTVYAQWKKKASSINLNAEEKKLVGTWANENKEKNRYDENVYYFKSYKFNADGTFSIITSYRQLDNTPVTIYNEMRKGKWRASGGAIYLIDRDFFEGSDKDMKMWNFGWVMSNTQFNYQLSSDGKTINTNEDDRGITTLYKK